MISSTRYSKDFATAEETIEKNIGVMEGEIDKNIHKIFPESNIKAGSLDDPLQLILDNITLSFTDDSSSFSRKSLFKLVTQLSTLTGKQSIIIIDDFNNDFDDETTISFFNELTETDAVCILSTSHTIPQSLLNDETRIFASREQSVIALPKLSNFLLDSIDGQPEYTSFEEYMLGRGYLKGAEIDKRYLSLMQRDELSNFLRVLTSKSPVLTDTYDSSRICIIPRNIQERKIYESLFNILGLKSDND